MSLVLVPLALDPSSERGALGVTVWDLAVSVELGKVAKLIVASVPQHGLAVTVATVVGKLLLLGRVLDPCCLWHLVLSLR